MDWFVGILTLLSMELIARRRWEGWLVGILNQATWMILCYQQELWGLMPLQVILSWRFTVALMQWRKENRAKSWTREGERSIKD